MQSRIALIIVFVLLVTNSAYAQVIYSQTPPQQNGLSGPGFFSNVGGQEGADQFTLPGELSITAVTWFGFYQVSPGVDPTTIDFSLSFWADAGGVPATNASVADIVTASVQSTGLQVIGGVFDGRTIFEFSATLTSPVSVPAGQTAWISVAEVDPSTGQWLWSFAPSDPGDSKAFRSTNPCCASDWQAVGASNGNLAFTLEGTQSVDIPAVNFNGQLAFVEVDEGGAIYSGVPIGSNFLLSFDLLTGSSTISDGTTITPFSAFFEDGSFFEITNNDILDDPDDVALINSLAGTDFVVGDVIDLIEITGEAPTPGGGIFAAGAGYLLDPLAFDDESPDNFPPDPSDILLTFFIIEEENNLGQEIYIAVGAAPVVDDTSIVVPNALEFVEGNSGNCIPLTGCLDADRYQQVYGSAEFGGLAGLDPVYISEIRFRPNNDPAFIPIFITSIFADIEIRLSTTPALFGPDGVTAIGPDNLFTAFDQNVGGDEVVVYRGALTLSSSLTGPGPFDFDIVITLQTPFLYDPTAGNLLFEWRNYSGESFGGFADSEVTFGDSVSRVESSFFPGDPEAPNGLADTSGHIARFTFIPPEDIDVVDVPTPVGEDVPVVQVTEFFEMVATEVVIPGTTSAFFCVGRDRRYTIDRYYSTEFTFRSLGLSELAGSGSCRGPVVEGEPETWEELLARIDLRIPALYRSYHSEFTIPGDLKPTAHFWIVVAVVKTTAEFDGVNSVINFPEALLDFGNTPMAETPDCDRNLLFRQLELGGPVAAFDEFPSVDGRNMTLTTGQCNRSRGMTRRTTHAYPLRLGAEYWRWDAVEEESINTQFSGIGSTLDEAASCADPVLIADMRASLQAAEGAFFGHPQRLDDAEEHLEEIARSAMNSTDFGSGDGFFHCPVEANYHGTFFQRGVSAAFTVHDRWQHWDSFVKYLLPADFDVFGFESEMPPIP